MDLVLIALLMRAAAPGGFRQVAFAMLGIGFVLMLIADVAYAVLNFGTDYELGGAADAAWLLSYAFLGAALLQPQPNASRARDVLALRWPRHAGPQHGVPGRGIWNHRSSHGHRECSALLDAR